MIATHEHPTPRKIQEHGRGRTTARGSRPLSPGSRRTFFTTPGGSADPVMARNDADASVRVSPLLVTQIRPLNSLEVTCDARG